ncbi:MAG: nucleotide exchange factor GrpE [Sulfurovum sp.]|nr:nucleotide exchange factor GrpE [Sulfurovum sp.]MCB4745536.1 nucleotide exchange factor GrpE [Sulfurovum sp.]MCB4749756.1 nucleotide exchange factor GrpE [Sulfurovum sp.]MCB4761478.1 nucleotide exchange factor GrpE [Sulfurovum sp.]MCB4777369.1 nucleotide exchange factor GrpE [Sulfurovum sp.]
MRSFRKRRSVMSQETKEDLEQIQNEEQVEETKAQHEENTQEVDPLETAKAEAAEYKDKYIRAHADFENAKKRLEKDKANAVSYANESFAKDILAVIDSFEQALTSIESAGEEHSGEVLEKMKEGVKLTYEQLKKVLEKNYIKEIVCDSEFDPEVHQAIMQVESDEHESGSIVQVMQKGYTIKDRVLRPAMVSTCK